MAEEPWSEWPPGLGALGILESGTLVAGWPHHLLLLQKAGS